MKKIIVALLCVFALNSCNNDEEVKMPVEVDPVEFEITLLSPEGINLLNPETNPNYDQLINETYAEIFLVYSCAIGDSSNVIAKIVGVGDDRILKIGTWNGNVESRASVILLWPDYTSDNIEYKNVYKYNENGEVILQRRFFLNDYRIDSNKLTLVKNVTWEIPEGAL